MPNENQKNTSLIILSGLLVALLFVTFVLPLFGRWNCVEGTCEKTFGGTYSSKKNCQNSCANQQPKVSFNCENNKCVQLDNDNGQYDELEDCQNNCMTQPKVENVYTVSYPAYYPTYGYNYPIWGRRGPRRHWRRRHGGRRRRP